MTEKEKKILIIAGEHSGDLLGAPLIRELKNKNPGLQFFGIGGEGMINEGLNHVYHMDYHCRLL